MHTFISKPKLPAMVYYTGKHVSCVFEDLRKMKTPTVDPHSIYLFLRLTNSDFDVNESL
jgi:hypothetical protein